MQEQLAYVLDQIRGAWRFRWLALAAAWLAALGGWTAVSVMPDVYEASARVYVDTTSQLRQILGNQIIEPDLQAQLNYVREAMLGRVQLERVARETGLAESVRTPEELERLVERLRRQIDLSYRTNPLTRDNLYVVSYRDVDRGTALEVVETVLEAFVEDALGTRRQGSESARRFLEEQVREYEARLAVAEERLAAFKREHADVLPGSEGGYFQRLQAETAALEDVERQLELAESRRDRMREQLRGAATAGGPDGELLPTGLEERIAEHQTRLEELALQYTERHPDVVAARETLQRLHGQREEQLAALAAAGDGGAAASNNPVLQALRIGLNDVEVEIASLRVEVERRRTRVARLRSLMEEVPEVEAQLARLDRDYDVVNAQYQALLRNLETERLTREFSETDQLEFRVIDPPSAPSSPVAPRRALLLAAVLVAAVGGGGALALLLAQLRPVFANPKLLREVTGLPVLGAVSLTWKERRELQRRVSLVSFALAGLGLVIVFGVLFVVEVRGPGLRAWLV